MSQGIIGEPSACAGSRRGERPSVAINNVHGEAIIMAGSGMCTGSRVCHHLQHNLGRVDSSVVFVGYASESVRT
ncbi:MAG: hypothetical protein WBF73_02955 [Bradyrhizobium sp.]